LRKYNGKLLIKPSKKAIRRFEKKVGDTLATMKTAKTYNIIRTLNPLIRGWGNYYRHVVSKEIFIKLDHWIWQKTWQWAKRRHRNKSLHWIADKYYCCSGDRRWIFYGDNETSERNYVYHLTGIPIRRHIKIRSCSNPYDPKDERYFESRLDKKWEYEQGSPKLKKLYDQQKGTCPLCRAKITTETGWNTHHIQERHLGGGEQLRNLLLLHPECHRQLHALDIKIEKLRMETCVIKA